jgi:hypothetical protein
MSSGLRISNPEAPRHVILSKPQGPHDMNLTKRVYRYQRSIYKAAHKRLKNTTTDDCCYSKAGLGRTEMVLTRANNEGKDGITPIRAHAGMDRVGFEQSWVLVSRIGIYRYRVSMCKTVLSPFILRLERQRVTPTDDSEPS